MKLSAQVQQLLVILLVMLQIGLIAPVLQAEGSDISIINYSVSSDAIGEGEQFTLKVSIKIESKQSLSQVWAELEDASGFTLAGSQPGIDLAQLITPGQSESFSINMVYQGGGDGQIPLRFTYNKSSYPHPISEEKYLSVPLDREGSSEGDRIIAIEDKETIYTSAGSQVKASIKLQNISGHILEEVLIKASFDSDTPFSFPAEHMFYFRSWASSETKIVNLNLSSQAEAANGTYILQLKGQFMNPDGEKGTSQESLYIKLQNTQIPPKLLIDAQPNQMGDLIPGQVFELPVRIKNQGQIAALDITISLEGTSPSAILLSSGSNKKYMDIIRGGSEERILYLLETDPALPSDIYPLLIKATYTDQSGKFYSTELEIELEVRPETVIEEEPIQSSAGGVGRVDPVKVSEPGPGRLKVGNIRFAGDMKVGKLIELYCTYYSTGRSDLNNLIIKIEGNFKAADKTVFMGNMEHNSSGYYQTAFEPQGPGEIQGQLVFSYQDGSGEPLVLVEPFSLSVAADDTQARDIDDLKGYKAISSWYLFIPILLIVAVLAGWQIQRRRQQFPEASSEE